MADVIVSHRAAERGVDLHVDSAGISDEEHGNPIDHRAARVLRDAGYAVPDHTARQVRPGDIADFDLVLAMTERHRSALERLAGRDGADGDNIRMWRDFDPRHVAGEPLDVPDPWYGGHEDFLDTLEVIEAATDAVIDAALAAANSREE